MPPVLIHHRLTLTVALSLAVLVMISSCQSGGNAPFGDAIGATDSVPPSIPPPTAADGVRIGAYVSARDRTASEADEHFAEQIGGSFGLVRVYQRWDDAFPTPFHRQLREDGRTMLLSVRAQTRSGVDVSWRDIAEARPGSDPYDRMVKWADSVKAYGVPVYVIFHHEPEGFWNTNGDADDFVAAWRNWVTIFRSRGADNVEFVWNMTGGAFASTGRQKAQDWYPGDDVVDHLGADPYNWYQCRGGSGTWRSLEVLVEPFRRFGANHPGKGLMLPEWGTVEDDARPGRKAEWLDQARTLFTRPGYEQFVALTYFHSEHGGGTSCYWWLDSSPSALAAFGDFLDDPAYRSD